MKALRFSILAAAFALLGLSSYTPALAQSTPLPSAYVCNSCTASLAVTNASGRVALPSTSPPYGTLTVYNSGAKDAYFVQGDVTAVATTSGIKIPAGTRIAISVNGTYVAAITGGSDTTTLLFWQSNGLVDFGGASAGSSGGGAITGNVGILNTGSTQIDPATSQKQDTGNTSLATIATNSALQATAANQSTANSSLSTIATNTTGAATGANVVETHANAGSDAAKAESVQGITGGKAIPISAASNIPVSQATASSLNATVIGAGAAGSANAGVLTVQGIAGMTKLLVTPDSVALPANQSVNVAQVGGATTSTGTGASGSGTQRVVTSTDSTIGVEGLDGVTQSSPTNPLAGTVYDANGTRVDFTTPALVVSSQQKPNGATQSGASASAANAINTATMTAQSGKTNFVCQVMFTADGSTTGLAVAPTITGLLGGTRTFAFNFPAGVAVGATPLVMSFTPCLPASGTNVAISAVLPAGGAGNTQASSDIEGFFQ